MPEKCKMTGDRQRPRLKKRQVVVVTGASSGIGRALARQLVCQDNRVYALARSLPQDLPENTPADGFLYTFPLDVTDEKAAHQVIQRIIQLEGRIDILIQAAGYGWAGPVEAMNASAATQQMQTNFVGSCNLLAPVLRLMRKQQSGLVVQLGSVAGFMPIPFQACYSASKAAVAALMLALANEVKPFGIRCLLVQPGDTRTGFTAARIISDMDTALSYAERCHRSVARMAADEQKGMPAEQMARLIIRRINRKKPPLIYTPGLMYKAAALLQRLLPARLVNAILYRMYAA